MMNKLTLHKTTTLTIQPELKWNGLHQSKFMLQWPSQSPDKNPIENLKTFD